MKIRVKLWGYVKWGEWTYGVMQIEEELKRRLWSYDIAHAEC